MKSNHQLQLKFEGLYLPLRTTFKQASSTRDHGESIWCQARSAGSIGYGEGCPRVYVTGENVETGLQWLHEVSSELEVLCQTLSNLKKWIEAYRSELDAHPAAWCAIETALLDLFAQQENLTTEEMLGLGKPKGKYQYTAVLGDGTMEKFVGMVSRYLSIGLTDFKIKVGGELEHDRNRINEFRQLAQKKGIENLRIRLDANNLWIGKWEEAVAHLSKLEGPFLGVEEPVGPKEYEAIGEVSEALNLPVILDESLRSLDDFKLLDEMKGDYIANLKVSRLGGVLRSLEMVDELKKRAKKIIVGAHVGETSVLTRAAMCVAQSAGEYLLAQEGGFGEMLLEKDKVEPSLKFGAGGVLNLENIGNGWGLSVK